MAERDFDSKAARDSAAVGTAGRRPANRKARIALTVCVAAVLVLAVFLAVTRVVLPNQRYQAAVELYEAGRYEEAAAAFEALGGYRDSAAQLEACRDGIRAAEQARLIESIQVGDVYVFGAYEQDGDSANGKEAIEWIVLDKDGTSLLLISKYALDCQPYHTPYSNVTWEACTLRAWLNDSFLNEAFEPGEQARIRETAVKADGNPAYDADPGSDTSDRIFLLSTPEAERYFPADSDRQCQGTAYCLDLGAQVDDEVHCWWMLRTPGYAERLVSFVTSIGNVSNRGDGVANVRSGIRPVLWVELSP